MDLNAASRTAITIGWVFLFFVLTSCGTGSSPGSGGNGDGLAQLLIAPQSPILLKGDQLKLTATAVYKSGKQQDVTGSATWKTSDPSVATIDGGGHLSAAGVGGAQVSGLYQGVSGTDSVTVSPAALVSIAVTPNSSSLPVGESEQMTATGTFGDGSTQDVTQSVTWSSSATGTATVSASGIALAKAVGTATISASSGSITGSAQVIVTAALLVSITVTPNPSSLPVGESEQLTAIGTFTDGSKQNLTQSATWNSSATAIASVSAGGSAVANAVGTATISATSGTLTGSAQVTVTPAVPTALNIVPSTFSMVVGGSRQLQAIATYSDGSTQDATGQVQWSSSATNIVSVSDGGMCAAQQVGTATISASESNLNADSSASVLPLVMVNYFDLASAQASNTDGTLYLTNPGVASTENLCAMIYVFDQGQELNECCGCTISDSGLRTLSLVNDLTSNPLTGVKPKAGLIKIVPSDPTSNPQCNPASLTPSGVLLGWETNMQAVGDGTYQTTETGYKLVPLTAGDQSVLVGLCSALQTLGSGQGICSCGTGD